MKISYKYFIINKETGDFNIFFSLKDVLNFAPILNSKSATITNYFRALEKENKPTIINDWGFKIYRKLKN